MPIRTNEFQRLIAVIQSHLDTGSTVTESAMLTDLITGAKREVDVTVAGQVGGHVVTVSIECRDRTRGPDVTWIDEMRTKHSRLSTNVLVLVSHRPFTPEARRAADIYGIRCLVLDDVDPTAPDRLFPNTQSLWGKGSELTVDRVQISVGAVGELPPEVFLALPENQLLLDDGTEFASAAQHANALLSSHQVAEMVTADAQPEHSFLQLVVEHPVERGRRVCVQKLEPQTLRQIESIRIVAKLKVTIDEFPLRHGLLEGMRIAWSVGTFFGKPAMLIATAGEAAQTGRITLHLLPPDSTTA